MIYTSSERSIKKPKTLYPTKREKEKNSVRNNIIKSNREMMIRGKEGTRWENGKRGRREWGKTKKESRKCLIKYYLFYASELFHSWYTIDSLTSSTLISFVMFNRAVNEKYVYNHYAHS